MYFVLMYLPMYLISLESKNYRSVQSGFPHKWMKEVPTYAEQSTCKEEIGMVSYFTFLGGVGTYVVGVGTYVVVVGLGVKGPTHYTMASRYVATGFPLLVPSE